MTARSYVQRFLTVAPAALILAACAVGPRAPDADLPPQASGAFVGSQSAAVSPDAARDDWWRLYQDPTLDALITQAFAENNDLEAAAANLRAVRASLSEARAGRFPSTSLSASGQRSQSSAATSPTGVQPPEADVYDVGLDAS